MLFPLVCFYSFLSSNSFNFYIRALLHFLDPYKFNNKDEFVQNYKNLSSFNEIEVLLDSFLFIILHLQTEKIK